jgi:hypothetical protein
MTIQPYVSVHVRANYIRDNTHNYPEENAIRCANRLQQQYREYMMKHDSSGNDTDIHHPLPIYFASDTAIVTQRAIQYGSHQNLVVLSRTSRRRRHHNNDDQESFNSIVDTNTLNNPYHIDQPAAAAATTTTTNDTVLLLSPHDFYDTFVDLYLLAMGRCHTWGAGGYGSWAAVIASTPNQKETICPSIVHTKQSC